jgi:hypothetical protein
MNHSDANRERRTSASPLKERLAYKNFKEHNKRPRFTNNRRRLFCFMSSMG